VKLNGKNVRQQVAQNIRRNLRAAAACPSWKSTDKPARTAVLLGA